MIRSHGILRKGDSFAYARRCKENPEMVEVVRYMETEFRPYLLPVRVVTSIHYSKTKETQPNEN